MEEQAGFGQPRGVCFRGGLEPGEKGGREGKEARQKKMDASAIDFLRISSEANDGGTRHQLKASPLKVRMTMNEVSESISFLLEVSENWVTTRRREIRINANAMNPQTRTKN